MAIDSCKIQNGSSIRCAANNASLSFFLKFSLPFPPFPGGVENAYSQFSRKLFNYFHFFLADYDQGAGSI